MQVFSPAKETTNGVHTNTIIVTAKFPISIYYPIKKHEELIIEEYDFEKVDTFIKKFYKTVNIVVDSRLEFIAIVIHLTYPDYCLIFDIEDNHVKDIQTFLSSRTVLDLRGMYLYTVNGKKLIDLYLFIKHFCTNLSIFWNTEKATEVCERNNNFVDIVLNYIGMQKFSQSERTVTLVKEINVIVQSNFKNRSLLFNDINELCTTLLVMKMNENTVKVYF